MLGKKLRDEHGVRNLAELGAQPQLLTSSEQRVGLRYVHEFEHRAEMVELEAAVRRAAEASPPLDDPVCGSYRRGADESGDIDVLLCHPSYTRESRAPPGWLKALVSALQTAAFVTDVVALGEVKAACVCASSQAHGWRRVGPGDLDAQYPDLGAVGRVGTLGDVSPASAGGPSSLGGSSERCGTAGPLLLPRPEDIAARKRQLQQAPSTAQRDAAWQASKTAAAFGYVPRWRFSHRPCCGSGRCSG